MLQVASVQEVLEVVTLGTDARLDAFDEAAMNHVADLRGRDGAATPLDLRTKRRPAADRVGEQWHPLRENTPDTEVQTGKVW